MKDLNFKFTSKYTTSSSMLYICIVGTLFWGYHLVSWTTRKRDESILEGKSWDSFINIYHKIILDFCVMILLFTLKMKHSRAKPSACLQAIQPSAVWWCCANLAPLCCKKLQCGAHVQLHAIFSYIRRMTVHVPDQQFRKPSSFADSLLWSVMSQSSYKTYR